MSQSTNLISTFTLLALSASLERIDWEAYDAIFEDGQGFKMKRAYLKN